MRRYLSEKTNSPVTKQPTSCRPPDLSRTLFVEWLQARYVCCVTWLMWLVLSVVAENSAWWLLMAWHLFGSKTSAATLLWSRFVDGPKWCVPQSDEVIMRTSSNGNIFRASPLWGESTSHQWIPLAKISDPELWCFLWSAPKLNGWANNRDAGDLRRHRSHYDVTVMDLYGCCHVFSRQRLQVYPTICVYMLSHSD